MTTQLAPLPPEHIIHSEDPSPIVPFLPFLSLVLPPFPCLLLLSTRRLFPFLTLRTALACTSSTLTNLPFYHSPWACLPTFHAVSSLFDTVFLFQLKASVFPIFGRHWDTLIPIFCVIHSTAYFRRQPICPLLPPLPTPTKRQRLFGLIFALNSLFAIVKRCAHSS